MATIERQMCRLCKTDVATLKYSRCTIPSCPHTVKMVYTKNRSLPKLLRAIAGSDYAKATSHNIIFNAAADELEKAWKELDK